MTRAAGQVQIHDGALSHKAGALRVRFLLEQSRQRQPAQSERTRAKKVPAAQAGTILLSGVAAECEHFRVSPTNSVRHPSWLETSSSGNPNRLRDFHFGLQVVLDRVRFFVPFATFCFIFIRV